MTKRELNIATLIIVAVCFLVYGNTLKNDYSLDDNYVIVDNPIVEKGIKGIPQIFKSHYVNRDIEKHSYRPVTLATFAIEYQFFKANPTIGHLINLLLYTLTCIILLRLLLRLFRSYHWMLAALATFIFLFLPVHSEPINNIKSRDELLCLLFALSALFQFVKYADRKKWFSLMLGILLMILSLLSKASSVTFLAIIPLTMYFFTDIKWKRLLSTMMVICVALLLVKLGSMRVTGPIESVRENMFHENPFYENGTAHLNRIPMGFYTIGIYLGLLTFPKDLICYYGYNQVDMVGWGDPMFWVSAIVVLAIASLCIYKFRSKSPLVFGAIYFLIAISMFANVAKPVVGIIGERFTYVPSVGFAIAIAFLILKLVKYPLLNEGKKSYYGYILFGILSVFFISSTLRIVTRNQDWKDNLTLMRHDVKLAPDSAKLHALIGGTLFHQIRGESNVQRRHSMTVEAINHYKSSVDLYEEYYTSWNNMGTLYFNELKDYQSAKNCYNKAVNIRPEYPASLYSLGYCYELEGEFDKAIQNYQRVLEIDPEYSAAKTHLQNLLMTKSN
jgi:hypothetical protein